MKRKWMDEHIQFIKDNMDLTDSELAEHFNVSDSSLKSARQRYGLFKREPTTDEEDELIKKHYADCDTKWLAEKLGRTPRFLYNRAQALNIRKSEKFYDSPHANRLKKGSNIGDKTRFKKGHVPYNKGKKMSPETKKKVEHTFFEKGHKPSNTKYDGAITLRHGHRNRRKRPYYWIRLSESNWELLHRHIWMQEHGDIPPKHNVVFKDGDTMNCVLENLELITDRELADRNRDSKYPEELRAVIRLNNKLSKTINNG